MQRLTKKTKSKELQKMAIKTNKGKNKDLYKKEIVEKNNRVTLLTRSGRTIHKEHIKNLSSPSRNKLSVKKVINENQ